MTTPDHGIIERQGPGPAATLLGIVGLLLVGMLLDFNGRGQPTLENPAGANAGQAQPALELPFQDIHGEEVLLSKYRGRVVLVNFWATWCSPCKNELPLLDAYYQEHRDQGFVLLAVNVSDRPPEALAYAQEQGYTFPLLFDPPGNALVELGVNGLPVSVLVDEQGHLVKKWVGELHQEILDSEVLPYLEASARLVN